MSDPSPPLDIDAEIARIDRALAENAKQRREYLREAKKRPEWIDPLIGTVQGILFGAAIGAIAEQLVEILGHCS